jgi:hypothetical protein
VTSEIDNVSSDRDLPPKLAALQLTIAQAVPEAFFDLRLIAP